MIQVLPRSEKPVVPDLTVRYRDGLFDRHDGQYRRLGNPPSRATYLRDAMSFQEDVLAHRQVEITGKEHELLREIKKPPATKALVDNPR